MHARDGPHSQTFSHSVDPSPLIYLFFAINKLQYSAAGAKVLILHCMQTT